MRILDTYLPSVLLALALVTLVTICETKETKKKTTKLRGDLNETDTNANATNANSTVEEGTSEPVLADVTVPGAVDKEEQHTETDTAKPQKPTYMNRVKVILKKVLEALGLRKEKRKNRMMDIDENKVQPKYREEVRATVGALLGRHECLKQAACGAGSYLRSFKSKDLILVLLEKVAPENWEEAVTLVKEGAVHTNECNYKCLEE